MMKKETEARVITFANEAEMPMVPASLASTLYNKTGSWRYMRPFYVNETPPCNAACPAGEDIVMYLQLTAQGRYAEAWETIVRENPFPGVCGRVCPHPCESECNREQMGGTIAIHCQERFLADYAAAHNLNLPPVDVPQREERVAVVGAGPAGLACAYHLLCMGYQVTVFEASEKLGGMMRLIPEYRLPKEVLEREVAAIIALGVEIKTGARVGADVGLDDLKDYAAVFLAVGQSRSRELDVPGEDATGVLHGIDFLARIDQEQKVDLGEKVAVIGGGNTAMDAARTARRLGADVTIFYRRSRAEMPAIDEEVDEALDEGVKIEFLRMPVAVLTGKGRVRGLRLAEMELGAPDESGRRRPVPVAGSEYEVELDTVIPALGQVADLSFLDAEVKSDRGRILTDERATTSCPPIFAGGDVTTGFGTVTAAVGSGKRAALAIDCFLRGVARPFPDLSQNVQAVPRSIDPTVVRFEDLNTVYFEEEPRPQQEQRPAAERVTTFEEVNLGYGEDVALVEARRCFSCGTCNECDNCLIFCPDVSVLRGPSDDEPFIFDYDYCKGCGVCVSECPRRAIAFEEEVKFNDQ
ncbi:MAG: NAD(P)-binding protein [Chloroflexota bacterium]|nr:NAD(P)-binding protein [Chloroflexota bacterium]